MINLYIFNETRRGAVYGVGTYIRELTTVLKGSEVNISVVHIVSDKPQMLMEETDGIRHWYIPKLIWEQRTTDDHKTKGLYYRNIVYLLQLHIKDRNNLIFQLNYNQCGSLVEELKKAFDCKIVAVTHFNEWGLKIYDNPQRLRNILKEEHPDSFGEEIKKTFEEDRSYYSKADHIVCLSNYMQEILCRDYGLDAAKISIIPNALPDILNPVANKKSLRRKWNIPSGEKIILFAGRVDDVKGVSFLIRAFHEIVEKSPKIRLIIAGSGDYDKYFQEAKNIQTKITFTGLLERDELYELYRIADVGIVPSLFEPFGLVAVEMMMHRLPVVVTATSGMNEVVDDRCGLKVPLTVYPDRVEIDTSLLAQQIMYLLQHLAEAKELGKNARKRYLAKYTSSVFGENMTALYQSLLHDE